MSCKENRMKKLFFILLAALFMGFASLPPQDDTEKTNNKDMINALKEAAYNACEAYKKSKSANSAKLVFSYAGILYKKGLTDDAIDAVELILNKEKPEYTHHYFLANLYRTKRNKEKEIYHLEQAYNLKKKSRLAERLGRLYYKNQQDIEKAIRYFAEAYVLYKREKASTDYRGDPVFYFPELYLEENESSRSPEFERIIKEAEERLKKSTQKTRQVEEIKN